MEGKEIKFKIEMGLEKEIMKAYRKYEASNYIDTKALNRYLKLTEWYEKRDKCLEMN